VLEEKLESYKEMGHCVALHKDPLVVVIVTPIMQRANTLRESSQIAFVDSTASCDCENHSLTFVLAPCAAGAVPLGLLITSSQSTADYTLAFSLFKAVTDPDGFGGKGHPLTFITDDSDAEQCALHEVWPESNTRLCLFHVQQAVWRWLWDAKHSILKQDRKLLMQSFQLLVRTTTVDVVNNSYASEIEGSLWGKYPQWKEYMVSYWERRQLWCMAWRDSTMMGHNTNNYCESTIRLYKDIVLGRCKAYNVVTLVDFTCTVMEDYYRRRLRLFSQARVHKPRLILESLVRKAAYISPGDITNIDDMFSVPSEKNLRAPVDEHVFYTVNCGLGTCTCEAAKSGHFCKHQAAVWTHTGTWIPSLPPVSPEDRHKMAVLALGDGAEDISFYADFQQSIEIRNKTSSGSAVAHFAVQAPSENVDNITASENASDINASEESCDFKEIFEKMSQLSIRFSSTPAARSKILKRLNNINTGSQWETFLHTQGAGVSSVYRSGSAIRVQPTSLSRRRPSVTRGSKRIAAGRPPLSTLERYHRKRRHSLGPNITMNQPNAKQHGRAH
jgi:MULE transposase domain